MYVGRTCPAYLFAWTLIAEWNIYFVFLPWMRNTNRENSILRLNISWKKTSYNQTTLSLRHVIIKVVLIE